MAKINWEEGLLLEQRIAYLIREMEIHGVLFDRDKAIRQLSKLEGVMDRLYSKVRPYLNFYVEVQETKYSGPTKDFKVDNYNSFTLNKGDYQFVKKIKNKDGSFTKSSLMFDDPEKLSGPYSRLSFEEPTLSKRLKLIDQLLKCGWKPKERTEKGCPQLTVEGEPVSSLSKIGSFGKPLSNWYVCNHRKSQIEGFLDKEREDGRLTPGCNPCGTNTLRAKHSVIANLPRATSFWGRQARSLMMASPGYLMVGADLSGLELRCLAHRMKDPNYIDLVLNGDIHTYNMELAGLSDRDQAKTFIYAFLYGAGDAKIGSIVGGSAKDGKVLKSNFLNGLPSLVKLISKVQSFSENNGWLPTIDHRKVFVRVANGRILTHTALNTMLQCDGAVVAKRSLLSSYETIKERQIDANLLIYYHDEFQYEAICGYEDEVGQIMVDSMKDAGVFYKMRIPIDGEYKVGSNWSQTH